MFVALASIFAIGASQYCEGVAAQPRRIGADGRLTQERTGSRSRTVTASALRLHAIASAPGA